MIQSTSGCDVMELETFSPEYAQAVVDEFWMYLEGQRNGNTRD